MQNIQQSLVLEGEEYTGRFEAQKKSAEERRGIMIQYSSNLVTRYYFEGQGLIIYKPTQEQQRFDFRTQSDNFSHWTLEESLIEFKDSIGYSELKKIKPRFVNPKQVYDLVLRQLFEDCKKRNNVSGGIPSVITKILNLDELVKRRVITGAQYAA